MDISFTHMLPYSDLSNSITAVVVKSDFKSHRRATKKSLPMQTGILVMWNDKEGYGFIRSENSEKDYFAHISGFKKGMNRRPIVGDTIRFLPDDNIPNKHRVSFALIEELEVPLHSIHEKKKFVLNPKQRSWVTNILIIIPLILSGYLLLLAKNPIPFFSYFFFSILVMFLYGTDKAHAATKQWRIPEVYLHALEIMGGWPGALIAQSDFRHKTRKSRYQTVFKCIILLHLLVWVLYLVAQNSRLVANI